MGLRGRVVWAALLFAALATTMPPGLAAAETDSKVDSKLKTLRDQIVGTWILVSAIDVRKDGTTINRWGANPKGTFIFTPDGRYAQVILRSDALFGAKNVASFGSYTIDERDRTIITNVDASSNPNYSGTERKRIILKLTDDEMAYVNPATTAGTSVQAVWKRAR